MHQIFDESNLKVLENQLLYESMMNKKYNQYANLCEDIQLKNLCHKAAKIHKKNFKMLLDYLNSYK
ncbi:hypothetical protein SAMN02745883_01884 [Caminicella sporogenes DSM 14501]|uniref:Spore coat protein n=1 Tax=Caminicella sporogenes DSM 14501 TaxID=1121266 RepID=A0A1M6RTZ1_9FIRM|nr:hypothetical protein [Caminicella sporogenes]RKD23647.1 hypothetical protein BET04_04420 [Caminicella sporogenes]WIF93988.1 hypothetical protein QNI18_06610 [Caminicella sporogenes]SHK35981.1 hypothetical protein SAMN02745883_01884 [Caminicella sporogenes DSM 14501]